MSAPLKCSKGHEMAEVSAGESSSSNSSSDSTPSSACTICAKALTTGSKHLSCKTCQFGVCDDCQAKLQKPSSSEAAVAVAVENPQSQIQEAQALLLSHQSSPSPEDTEKALRLYQQALETRSQVLGDDHVTVADTHADLAARLVPLRHYTTSMIHYGIAVAIYQQQQQQNSSIVSEGKLSSTQQAMQKLEEIMVEAAQSYMMQGMDCQARQQDNIGALQHFENAYSLIDCVLKQHKPSSTTDEKLPPESGSPHATYSLALADVCRVLASVHVSSSQYTAALPFLEQAAALLSATVGPNDERTLTMTQDLETVRKLLQKHATKHNQRIPHWYERKDYVAEVGTGNNNNNNTADNDAILGISVHYLKTGFWRDHLQAKGLDATSAWKDALETLLKDNKMGGASFLASSVDKGHTGPANLMLCHAKESTVGDIINSLDEYCRTHTHEEDGKPTDDSTYVWMDGLCDMDIPASTSDTKTMKAVIISKIQHVLAILTPWYHPLIWKNPQCLQEIYMASQTPNCQLTLVLPPAQTLAVSDAIIGDPTAPMATLYEALDHLTVVEENSLTSSPDPEAPSVAQLKLALQDIFRPWIRDIVKAQVQQQHSTTGPSTPNTMAPAASPTNSAEALKLFQMQLSNKMGLLFWNYGEHKTALEMLEDALSMTEAMYGAQHESTATVYQNIANVLSDMGKYELALEAYHKALAISEATLSENHPRIAETCGKLGNLYRLSNQLDKAMEYHQKALTIQKQCYGSTQNLPCAESYRQLAFVFFARGDMAAALSEFQKALSIQESVLGEEGKNHPTLAASHCHLGMVYKTQQNYSAAEREYKQAAAIYEATHGKLHIETATTFDHVASVLRLQDNLDGALEWYEQSRAMYENILGLQHPTTAQAYHTVGELQNETDHVEEALANFQKALDIRQAVLGTDHPTTAASLQSIGTLHFEIGELDEALEELRKAFDILEPILGIEHSTTKQLADTINAVMEA